MTWSPMKKTDEIYKTATRTFELSKVAELKVHIQTSIIFIHARIEKSDIEIKNK